MLNIGIDNIKKIFININSKHTLKLFYFQTHPWIVLYDRLGGGTNTNQATLLVWKKNLKSIN
jgi:hypothetical protein